MNQRHTRRSGVFRRVWRWILNPDAAIAEKANDTPSRMLTREERRAFEREERWIMRFIVGLILAGILTPTIFLVVEVFDGLEERKRAAREASYIPPR